MSQNEMTSPKIGSRRTYPARISIAELSARSFRLPFRSPFRTSDGTITNRDGLILRLVTDDGVVGIGEASPHPALGPAGIGDVEQALGRVAPRIVGTTLSAAGPTPAQCAARCSTASESEEEVSADAWMDGLPMTLPPALACAFDTAACDALARTQGLSLALLFGERIRTRVPVNATIGGETLADVIGQARAARAKGFKCVKLKVGAGETLEKERERVAAVRRELGQELRLRLDANGAWNEAQAIAAIRALEAYGIEFIEQPIRPGNLDAMRRLRRAVQIPIAADEDVTSLDAAGEVLEREAAGVLVVKPMVIGGLRAARRVAKLADEHGVPVIVTTTIDSGIGTAAALQLSATLPESDLAFGLATGELLAGDLIEHPLPVRDGEMELPAGPGLGVTLDEAELEHLATGDVLSWKKA